MFKKIFLSLFILTLLAPLALMQKEVDLNELRPVITSNNFVQVEKNIIFDASQSFLLDGIEPIYYEWDFGDGSLFERGDEVVHSYARTGEYPIKLTVTQGKEKASIQKDIFVYERFMLLLTDVSEEQERINNLIIDARDEDIFIKLIDSYDGITAFMSEESLAKKLVDQVDVLPDAGSIVIWTTKGSGINALTRLVRDRPETQEILADKTIVIISDKNLNTLGRIMQSNFNITRPRQIIITRQYELRNLIASPDIDTFMEDLQKSIADYKIISEETGRVSVLNSISYLVSFMVTNGIPGNTIVLLLMLPVIATIIALLKQVIGITTFGLYTPSIITLSFLALGLKFGLTILVIIIVTGAILHRALERFHLLHIPRISIILTISSLILLLMLAFGTYLNINQIASIAVFPMLIMTTLAEKFVSAQSGKGFFAAMLLMLETTVVSLICYWVVEWQFLQNLILAYPEIILLLIVANYGLGRWTGLRLLEYVRFREVMKHAEE